MFNLFKIRFTPTDDAFLVEKIKSGALLVDICSSGEFTSGSVEGSVNLPLSEIHKQLSRFASVKTRWFSAAAATAAAAPDGSWKRTTSFINLSDGKTGQSANNILNSKISI